MSNKNTKKKVKLIVAALLVVMIFSIGIGSYLYVYDYYKPQQVAVSAMANTELYSVETTDFGVAYIPKEITGKGLIFYPGGKVEHTAYAPLMAEYAKNGVLCVLVKMPLRLAVLDMNAADGISEKYADINEWYIGGHSLGGAMAASYVSEHQNEFKGLILLGAYSTADLSQSGLNVLSIYGSEDRVLNKEKYSKYKSNLPEDFKEIVINGGCHSYFGDYGAQDGDGTPTISQIKQIEITVNETIKWFK